MGEKAYMSTSFKILILAIIVFLPSSRIYSNDTISVAITKNKQFESTLYYVYKKDSIKRFITTKNRLYSARDTQIVSVIELPPTFLQRLSTWERRKSSEENLEILNDTLNCLLIYQRENDIDIDYFNIPLANGNIYNYNKFKINNISKLQYFNCDDGLTWMPLIKCFHIISCGNEKIIIYSPNNGIKRNYIHLYKINNRDMNYVSEKKYIGNNIILKRRIDFMDKEYRIYFKCYPHKYVLDYSTSPPHFEKYKK